MSYKHITFFLSNGQTLRFNNVTEYERHGVGTEIVKFKYVSASDGLEKVALFDLKPLLGVSFCSM